MRLTTLLFFFLAIGVIASAQDTNFSSGPQYLMNFGSRILLRPIATPTLSLSAPLATAPTASPEEGSGEPHTPAFGELQSQAQIDRIYWGVSDISATTLQSESSAADIVSAKNGSAEKAAENRERSSEIELSSTRPTQPLPSSIFDAGVTGIADAASLRERGYGMPLGDVATLLKANERHTVHVYTNADIARLHGG